MSTSPSPAAPTAAPFDEAAFEAFVASRDEPEWVSQRRREAFAAYEPSAKRATGRGGVEAGRVASLSARHFRPATSR
ncbi:MAG: hypothetical protein Ct9H300mP1_15520 [Planctomycetaceae bacterium]|nr:MAG: hypothetical protein Ct9H300mP1_15520 [Planctomycetaceae bacterium]